MPVKKKTAKKKSTKKGLGLFDHIKHINQVQNPNYFDTLTDGDKSSWNSWMILRSLSFNPHYTVVMNELQSCLKLKPELMYKLLIDILPKDRGYYPFITGKSRVKYGDKLISIISEYFEISQRESIDYLNIFYMSDENKSELKKIVSLYDMTEKEIEGILKR